MTMAERKGRIKAGGLQVSLCRGFLLPNFQGELGLAGRVVVGLQKVAVSAQCCPCLEEEVAYPQKPGYEDDGVFRT